MKYLLVISVVFNIFLLSNSGGSMVVQSFTNYESSKSLTIDSVNSRASAIKKNKHSQPAECYQLQNKSLEKFSGASDWVESKKKSEEAFDTIVLEEVRLDRAVLEGIKRAIIESESKLAESLSEGPSDDNGYFLNAQGYIAIGQAKNKLKQNLISLLGKETYFEIKKQVKEYNGQQDDEKNYPIDF